MSSVPTPPTGQPQTHQVKLSKHELEVLRKQLLQARPFCHYCGRRVSRKSSSLDHVLPLSRGGDDRPSNLVLACKVCNEDKGTLTAEEYFIDSSVLDVPQILKTLNRIDKFCDQVQTLSDEVRERVKVFTSNDVLIGVRSCNFKEHAEPVEIIAFPEGGAE